MDQPDYRGHRVRTYASFRGPWWTGAFQIDGGVVVIIRGAGPVYDSVSAHWEAYGEAVETIDAKEREASWTTTMLTPRR